MSIFFLISLIILLINIVLLIFNNFKQFNLKINCLINSAVFYFNILFFIISLNVRNNKYNLSDSKEINKEKINSSAVVVIIIMIFYYLTKQFQVLCKPFSDLFGYFIITYDTNKVLNVSKKPNNNILNIFYNIINPIRFIKFLFTKTEKMDYLNIVKDYDNNWKKLINSTEYNNYKGQNWKTVIFDYVDNVEDTNLKILQNVLNQNRDKKIDYSELSNLFDRKFIVSKTIYVILLSIILISYYNIIISI